MLMLVSTGGCFPLQFYPRVLAELADLQEIYDPDLMELIAWIRCFLWTLCTAVLVPVQVLVLVPVTQSLCRSQAPAVFAGSPVLLGTIKLCSGSVVTSLPVYSDLDLLRRTEDVSSDYFII